jgi:hypothetical protein
LGGGEVYGKGAVNAINSNVGMAIGKHTLLVRTWDTSSAYGDQTLTLTVSSKPAVAVSTPSPTYNVTSPISIHASATPTSGHVTSGWDVYVDGVMAYHAGTVSSIQANVTASPGSA